MSSSATAQFNAAVPMSARAVAKATRRKGRRDSYTRFSALEEAQLLDGVSKYGAGKWKKILTCYQFHRKRTAVDLKDKYRNIVRARERHRLLHGVQHTAASTHCGAGNHAALSSTHGAPAAARDVHATRSNSQQAENAPVPMEKRMEAPSAMKLARLLCDPESEG